MSNRRAAALAAAMLAALVCVPAGLGAQDPPSAAESAEPMAGAPTAAAVRTGTPPRIDGLLDDAVWAAAPPITGFVQQEPREGAPASERTEVRILFDDEAVYVGVRLLDSQPDSIVVGENRRDASLDNTDAFLIVLDTYRDRQNAFVFGTTPAGIEYDGQVATEGAGGAAAGLRQVAGSGGGFNLNWDGSWEVATSRDADGWYAEFRIPFSTLRFGRGSPQTWGLNFARYVRRRNERSFWAPIPRQFNLFRVSLAGALEGIEVPAARTLHVTPYVLASARRDFAAAEPTEYPSEVGGDVKVGLTRSLTLDATLNTDFAQVEVDEQQVNLTRFSLFFPEKRPFFLENAGIFAVGSPQAVEMFFSRRIGIGPGGEPVPILGGGRLSGRVGGFGVGLLGIRTRGVDEVQPENQYTVARVARELPNRSRIGGIAVDRFAPGAAGDRNRTVAVDGRLGVGDAVTFAAWAARTSTPELDGRDRAYSVQADYTTRDWRGSAGVTEVGEDFNPEVGFLARSGYRSYQVFALRHVRLPRVAGLRELRPHVSYRGYFRFDGFEETRYIHLDSHIAFENGAFFSPAFNLRREGLVAPFEIAPGIVVPPGTYDNVEAAWRFNTDESAMLSLNGGIDYGGFLSGTRRGGFLSTTLQQRAVTAVLRVERSAIDLAEGSFDATLLRFRLGYAFTPRVFAQSLVQYNSQAGAWMGNVRFGWLNTAGTGLFVVYNEGRATGLDAGPLDRAMVVKFTRRFDLLR